MLINKIIKEIETEFSFIFSKYKHPIVCLKNNMEYCPFCKKKVTFHIKTKDTTTYRYKTLNVKENIPICNSCGKEIYVMDIDNDNIFRADLEFVILSTYDEIKRGNYKLKYTDSYYIAELKRRGLINIDKDGNIKLA